MKIKNVIIFGKRLFLSLLIISCMSINDVIAQNMNQNSSLNAKQQSIALIAAHTAKGNLVELKTALVDGLDAGLSINEIKEVIVQLYAYCGFPRSLNVLNTFMNITLERKASGIEDVQGREATLIPININMYDKGEEIRTQLVGRPVTGKVYEFCPLADQFLRTHLFGDIFSRDNISFQYRELATIGALAASNFENQLRSHISICKNLGITQAQMEDFVSIISNKIGYTEGEIANRVVKDIFKSNNMDINKDQVTIQRVMFPNRNITVVGNLFLPADFNKENKYMTIVVGHPAGGVKEQTSGLYAKSLAEQGFVTLAFDASYQGESGGEPRGLEDPSVRTEDFRCAVDYLTTLPYVSSIGAIGICGGGGFAIAATITDHRILAVAGISAVDLGQLRRDGLGGTLKASLQTRLETAAKQRAIEAKGGEIKYTNYVPNSLDDIPVGAPSMYREGYEYYRTSLAQHPRSTNKYTVSSLDKLIGFTAFDHLELLSPRAILMIAGSKADSFYFSEDAYNRAAEPKQIYTVQGASHIQLYWNPEYVKEVTNVLRNYFTKYLKM